MFTLAASYLYCTQFDTYLFRGDFLLADQHFIYGKYSDKQYGDFVDVRCFAEAGLNYGDRLCLDSDGESLHHYILMVKSF